jgi:heat shock protein HtpX
LAVFCLVWGFGGAFISLGLSRLMAKWMMGVQVVPPDTREPALQQLVETVHTLARSASLPKLPDVGLYESDDVNAFATGPTKSRALVAVSTGLLRRMGTREVTGVLGHEVANIANGDMVTMTLIQGVINSFVLFLSRVIGHTIDKVVFKNERGHGPAFWITTIIAEIVLAILASIIVFYFSRKREYRADSSAAALVGKKPMIGALEALKASVRQPHLPDKLAAFGISGTKRTGLKALFSTHPDREERVAALEMSGYPDYK